MARTMEKRESGEANVPASQIVNIDLETKTNSREVLQVGIAVLGKVRQRGYLVQSHDSG
jgi:hypothetical protein